MVSICPSKYICPAINSESDGKEIYVHVPGLIGRSTHPMLNPSCRAVQERERVLWRNGCAVIRWVGVDRVQLCNREVGDGRRDGGRKSRCLCDGGAASANRLISAPKNWSPLLERMRLLPNQLSLAVHVYITSYEGLGGGQLFVPASSSPS